MSITTVVNLRKASYTVYIGRGGRGQNGTYGNPVERGKPCPECKKKHWDNDSIVQCYEALTIKRLETDIEYRKEIEQLHGETLGCFCKPQSCHGDILAKLADYLVKNNGNFNLEHYQGKTMTEKEQKIVEFQTSEDYVSVARDEPVLILIRGIPGAGKTSLIDKFGELVDKRVSADDYFYNSKGRYFFNPDLLSAAHTYCQEKVRTLFGEDDFKGIAVHNTFTCRWEMEPYLLMAEEFEIKVVIIDLFDAGCTDEELAKRNVHDVPLEVVASMRKRYEHDWRNGNPLAPWDREEEKEVVVVVP